MDNFSDVEGSIIAHQQVEIETLRERIAILEQGVQVMRDMEVSESMEKYIEREFKKNLELAEEEMRETGPDAYDLAQGYVKDDCARSAWNMANEWTCDDIGNQIACMIDRMWWEKQEAINKAHFD